MFISRSKSPARQKEIIEGEALIYVEKLTFLLLQHPGTLTTNGKISAHIAKKRVIVTKWQTCKSLSGKRITKEIINDHSGKRFVGIDKA